MGGSRESLTRRRRTLAQLDDRAEAVAHRMTTLDPSPLYWGPAFARYERNAFDYTEWGLKTGILSNATARPRKVQLRCEPP